MPNPLPKGFSHEVLPDRGVGKAPDCDHAQLTFDYDAKVVKLEDQNPPVFMLSIKAHCDACGLRFKFRGLPGGVSTEKPMCDLYGYEVTLPMEPGAPINP